MILFSTLPYTWYHSSFVLHSMCSKFLLIPRFTDVGAHPQLNNHKNECREQCLVDQLTSWSSEEREREVNRALGCVMRRDYTLKGRVGGHGILAQGVVIGMSVMLNARCEEENGQKHES